MQRHDEEQVPPELDPWFERYDDDRPPRTMARRFRPIIVGAAALTLVAMVLLVTQVSTRAAAEAAVRLDQQEGRPCGSTSEKVRPASRWGRS
jgi:hypothetical protein